MAATLVGTKELTSHVARSGVAAFGELARPLTLIAPPLGIASGATAGLASIGAPAITASWIANVALAAASLTALNAGSNALNQYCDRVGDALDKPSRPLPSGRLTPTAVLSFAAASYVLAAALAVLITAGGAGPGFAGPFSFIFVATIVYSVPPLRSKRRWWAALPTIALARGLALFLLGWAVSAPLADRDPWIIGSVLALFLLGTAATKDWTDQVGDAATDCRTLPLDYGDRGAAIRIAPFFIFPWLILLLVRHSLRVDPNTLVVVSLFLLLWGLVAIRSLLRSGLSVDPCQNHPAWRHMYAMLAAAHVGVAASYILAR